ncbi:MAG: hypothetical protein ACI8YQ_003713 [Polaribacter sp.]|jgi:uncharacterized protein (TIGR02453 family)
MPKQTHIPSSAFTFLRKLQKNNNRDWFKENKDAYSKELEFVKAFKDSYTAEMEKTDEIELGKMYRIYRDTRFSKNKTPYKNHFSGYLRRASKARRGSYYFHIEPGGNTVVGGGFFSPNPADLKHIRNHISADDAPLRKVLKSATFKKYFGTLQGNQVKTSPKGFDKNDPAIDLLRYKQFYIFRTFSDKEVNGPDFLKEVVKTSKAFRPFFDYMSDILTTNLNGESLL